MFRSLAIAVTAIALLHVSGAAQFRLRTSTAVAPANIIAANRQAGGSTALPNAFWAAAGVTGGIPTRTTICDTLTSSATMANINTALDNCPDGEVVKLSAGTYTLTGCIDMESNVTLRGDGPQTGGTILNITQDGSCGFYWHAGDLSVAFQGSFNSSGDGSAPGAGGVPSSTTRDFTGCNGSAGSYPMGCTVLDYSGTSLVTAGLDVGSTITLWQTDDDNANVPTSGFFNSDKCGTGTNDVSIKCTSEVHNAGHTERLRVTNVTSSQVTVSPGLSRYGWASGRSPKMAFQDNPLTGAGLEYLRIAPQDSTAISKVGFNATQDSWMLGVAVVGTVDANTGVVIFDSRNITIKDSWIGSITGGGAGQTTSYGINPINSSNLLIENNILVSIESPLMMNVVSGSVAAYNYEVCTLGECGMAQHEQSAQQNLYEGNDFEKFWGETIHGVNMANTFFRNYTSGSESAIDAWAYNRYWNIIGNVINSTVVYKALSSVSGTQGNSPPYYSRFGPGNEGGACIRLGYPTSHAQQTPESGELEGLGSDMHHDPTTETSAFLWGNYCRADATSHFDSGEVPTSDPVMPNTLPSNQTIPNSMYKSARPGFFTMSGGIGTTVAWPPIGPDATGGAISNVGGHAHKIPARVMYEFTGGAVGSFDPSLYGQ